MVLDKPRQFCCAGCHAVCETIVDAGLDDFYQYRQPSSRGQSQAQVPDIIKNLEVYDRPELQKGFVHQGDSWNEASLILEDIRCPACLWLNERHIRHQPGIIEVAIDSTTQRMRVRWDPSQTTISAILKAITEIGYIAHPYDARLTEELQKKRNQRSVERLIVAGLFGMMVMNFSAATYILGGNPADGLPLWESIGRWVSLAICGLLIAYPAQDFWIGAWRDFQHRKLGMDVPILLGISFAFVGSLVATITSRGDVYFDSIAMFVFFVLLARHFETAGKIKAMSHLDQLSRAIPQFAFKRQDQEWIQVPVLDLVPGDTVRVLPGETVPVDGNITEGRSSFDESLLTGESTPVKKTIGDTAIAGSVNGDQPVQVSVGNSSSQNTLDSIRRLVDRGLERKPASAQLADQIARYFVIGILLIAFFTASYWLAVGNEDWLSSTIAVLIVTCPCALALATPVALAVGAGKFVESGILPLRMDALEPLAHADTIAFDKTGTLTTGRPGVINVEVSASDSWESANLIATTLSQASEHPLAQALKLYGPAPLIAATAVENIPGQGITGIVNGQQYWLGRREFVESRFPNADSAQLMFKRGIESGNSLAFLADHDHLVAVYQFSDEPRHGAEQLVQSLQDDGVKTITILSGDTQQHADRLAQELQIETAIGGMLPEDKLDWVHQRQQRGSTVLMFGDGINDAPTLAAADVSISLSSGTDLANLSSDFLLLGERLGLATTARKVARKINRNIKQNLAWALGYNTLAIPFAAMGYVPPWLAAIGMSASSLIVVANALRIKR